MKPRRQPVCRDELLPWLEDIRRRFHRRVHTALDPIRFLYPYPDVGDREVAALVASSLAYGNVKAILKGVGEVLKRMGPSPRNFLLSHAPHRIRRTFAGFRYRVTSDADLIAMLVGARSVLAQCGGLEPCVVKGMEGADTTPHPLLGGLAHLVEAISHGASHPLLHLLPHPSRGSACKRLLLMCRWLVRHDRIDPGGWSSISPAQLIVPLDVHMHRISLQLGLTRRKQAALNGALEVTEALRAFAPQDPLRYDFAMTRPGILRVPFVTKPRRPK